MRPGRIDVAQMTNLRLRYLSFLLPICAIALGIGLLVVDPAPLQAMRNNVFDQFQRWSPRPYVDAPVRIVDIDEETLKRLGQWPWPRTRLAELVDRLHGAGAAAIGFDMVLAEPDRTSPARVSQDWPLDAKARQALALLPDNDEVLARKLAGADTVLGFVLQRGDGGGAPATLEHRPYRFVSLGDKSAVQVHRFDSVIRARPAPEQASAGYGALNFVGDNDGIIRRVPLLLGLGGEWVPTLMAEVLRIGLGEKNYFVKADARGGIEEVRVGQQRIPTSSDGELWLHYSRPVESRYLPAWKLMTGAVPQETLAGQIVLIGSSAQGLLDLRFSPMGGIVPGVEIHAQALEQVLSGQYLIRPAWALALEAMAMVIGGLLIAVLSVRARALLAALATGVMIAALLVGSWVAFREAGVLVNSVTPAIVLLTAFVLGSVVHHFISEREQRWLKTVFSRYVSPNRVEFLVHHPDAVKLGGERKECSFVFTDLANFTGLMEAIEPTAAVALLNDYLDAMIAIAFKWEGTLDRIVGDSVVIMFSAPVTQADHKARALKCALEMDAFAASYAQGLQQRGIGFGKTRIGIHSGEVIVGNFGGSTIFDYRALGDPVNTASRLESVNKQLGTTMCISAATLAGCTDARARPIGALILKGKTQAIAAFEPITDRCLERYAPIEDYLSAYGYLAGGHDETARRAFASLAGSFPEDPLVALHHQRISNGESGVVIVLAQK